MEYGKKSNQVQEDMYTPELSEEIVEIEKKLADDPTNPDLWMQKGIALRRQMLMRQAVEAYSIGLTHDPFHGLLYRHRGHSLVNIRRFAEAAADFEMGLRIMPENWDCWYHLGLAYHLMGNYERAKVVYEKCYELSDEAMGIACTDWYCMTLMKLGQIEEMKAIAKSRIRNGMSHEGSEGYYERCKVYAGILTPEEALAEAEKQDDHMYATGAYGIAVYYEYVLGDLDKAMAIYNTIAERDATWGGFAEHATYQRLSGNAK